MLYCNGGWLGLSWEGGLAPHSHPVIQDHSILFIYLPLFPLSPPYMASRYRKSIQTATRVFVNEASLQVVLLGPSPPLTSWDSVTCHTQQQGTLEHLKSSWLINLLLYCSKLRFGYNASPKLQVCTRKWTLYGVRRKILLFGSVTNYVDMVMASSSSNCH